MNSQNEKDTIYEDETNFYDIWKQIAKRKKLISGIFIIFTSLAVIISLTMPKTYRGEVAIKIQPKDLISTRELFEIIGQFDPEKIARIFPNNFTSINSVKIIQIPGSTDKFRVSIELIETAYFQDIIKVLVEYLNKTTLIKKAVEQSREQLLKKIEEIDVVMKNSQRDAESFQKMIVREKLNPIGFNPVQFNKMLSDLEIEKIVLRQTMRELTGFEIIAQPTISPKPVKPRPILYMASAGITGIIIGLFLAIFLDHLEKLKGVGKKLGPKR